MTEETAKRIVDAMMLELGGRSGMDWIPNLECCDPEVYRELHETLVTRVREAAETGSYEVKCEKCGGRGRFHPGVISSGRPPSLCPGCEKKA